MLQAFLVPEQTLESGGEGDAVALGAAAGKRFLVTLQITRIIEQQSLDVSIWGSEDSTSSSTKLLAFPQKFYTGTHELILDLRDQPAIGFVRAKWEMGRWGRGTPKPRFTFFVAIEELTGQAAA